VAGSLDAFPLLVKLSGDIADRAQSNGNDILFTEQDGTTKLLHEIESFNGELIAWVQLPHLSEKEDTDFYVYFGNPEAESQQSIDRVFDPNTYAGVWHLSQNPGTTQTDSTQNSNDGTPTNIDSQDGAGEGKIGAAINFDGVDDYISISYKDIFTLPDALTMTAWIRLQGTPTSGDFFPIVKKRNSGSNSWQFLINDGRALRVDLDSGLPSTIVGANSLSQDHWYHAAATWDGSSVTIYLDGSIDGTGTHTGKHADTTDPVLIGWSPDNITDTFDYFNGLLDHVTISSVARTPEWITTEYRSQCACEDFLTVGDTETQTDSVVATPAAAPVITSESSLTSPLMQALNSLYLLAYGRGPTFAEWLYWADRIINEEKTDFPELLGAMQWQAGAALQ